MAYFDWLAKIDLNAIIHSIIDSIFGFFEYCFGFLAAIPGWVKYIGFGFLVGFAILMAIVIYKRRNDWKKVYA